MKLPKLEKAHKYVGLYVFDFGDYEALWAILLFLKYLLDLLLEGWDFVCHDVPYNVVVHAEVTVN